MKNSNYCKSFIFMFFLVIVTSCDRLVEVDSARNLIASNDLFATENGYKSALAGIYLGLQGNLGLTSGGLSSYMSLASDDLSSTSASSIFQSFLQNSLLSSNSVVSNFWNQAYKGIYSSNLILEKIDDAIFIPEIRRNDYKGQALFVRAFYYFYLVQLFGDVPLVLISDYKKTSSLGRESSEVIWMQIIEDLKQAEKLIALEETIERSVPDKSAVRLLLARSYLVQKEFEKVIVLINKIEEEGRYWLLENLNEVFLKSSKETIWQISSVNSNVAEGMNFIPSSPSARPIFILSSELVDAFEDKDLRLKNWVDTQEVGNVTYIYPYKYKVRSELPPKEYNVVFRFAEVLLMRAESKLEIGDVDGALKDVEEIRKRAGLKSIPVNVSKHELRKVIENEKRLEYFVEWGHRWFDLKRKGDIDAVLSAVKPNWKSTAKLLPIPASQRLVNVNLTQNDGYDE